MTKEQLKKELEEKFYKWSKYGGFMDYEDHEVDTDLLWNWFDSQIDRIREDSVRDFVKWGREQILWEDTYPDETIMDTEMDELYRMWKDYLKSKSGGKE